LAASEYTVHARMNRHRSSPPELNPVSASLQAYRAYITELISLVTVPWALLTSILFLPPSTPLIDCTNQQQQQG
jgi:hypothetical protein